MHHKKVRVERRFEAAVYSPVKTAQACWQDPATSRKEPPVTFCGKQIETSKRNPSFTNESFDHGLQRNKEEEEPRVRLEMVNLKRSPDL
jgi:hypothetical protein